MKNERGTTTWLEVEENSRRGAVIKSTDMDQLYKIVKTVEQYLDSGNGLRKLLIDDETAEKIRKGEQKLSLKEIGALVKESSVPRKALLNEENLAEINNQIGKQTDFRDLDSFIEELEDVHGQVMLYRRAKGESVKEATVREEAFLSEMGCQVIEEGPVIYQILLDAFSEEGKAKSKPVQLLEDAKELGEKMLSEIKPAPEELSHQATILAQRRAVRDHTLGS